MVSIWEFIVLFVGPYVLENELLGILYICNCILLSMENYDRISEC
jgi:hypothetical protein